MVSACGRYTMVFNGEIYNHLDLRKFSRATSWRGHSDTETLLACFSEWGIEKTLRATVGMFALALFDSVERRLILARDRFGEKPLYWGYAADTFVFASELRALRVAPGFDSTIDRTALTLYMRHSCVPGPRSIYTSIRKLPPGAWLEITPDHVAQRSAPEPHVYWSPIDAALGARREPLNMDDEEATSELERLLGVVIKGQMLSDVPFGAFLSGGVDSSVIVALMQSQAATPVRTFSIGFADSRYDESIYARQVAAHLGTAHTELTVHADDALKLVPRMPRVYDEPFGDSSQLPTFLVAQLARRHVTVALSGDAGDELFAGYEHYFLASRVASLVSMCPGVLRHALARGVRAASPVWLNRLGGLAKSLALGRRDLAMAGDTIHKAADLLACDEDLEIYSRLVSCWWQRKIVLECPPVPSFPQAAQIAALNPIERMMLLDTTAYLPDDILVKVDRAAMAVSLETRVPMLDHRLFEFMWRLPMRMKVRHGRRKWLLKQLLHRYVPAALVDRPKMGFAVPLAAWLRGPLRDWAESILDERRIRQQGLLDVAMVRQRWHEHLAGIRDWPHELWNVLMFQAWLEETR